MSVENFGNQFDMFALKGKDEVFLDKRGYFRISENSSEIRFWTKNKLFHRWMVEIDRDRKLLSSEVVHHINGLKTDNRIDNLNLTTWNSHKLEHTPSRNLYRNHCQDCDKEWLKINDCQDCYARRRSRGKDIDDWDDNDESGWWDDDEEDRWNDEY